jgi:hypothetical protein
MMMERSKGRAGHNFTTVNKIGQCKCTPKGRSRSREGGKRKTSEEVDKPSSKENVTSEGQALG